MAKKSGGGKDSRSAKTGKSATASKAKQKHVWESEAVTSVIPRMHRNTRNGTLTVGKYRRISPYVDVTKR